ncbi:MAG: AI-2E family transporter [Nitrospirales bacterium]
MSSLPHPSDSPRTLTQVHLWEVAAFRDVIIGGLIILAFWVGYQLQSILVPVLIGLGMAYLTNPLLNYVEQTWKFPRWLAVSIIVLLMCAVLSGLGFWLGPLLADQILHFIETVPTNLSILADQHNLQLGEMSSSFAELSASVQNNPFSTIKTLLAGTGQVWNMTNLIIGTLGSFLLSASLIIIYFFFFSWNFPSIQQSLWTIVESLGDPRWPNALSQMDETVGAFFRGRLLIALIMSVMFGGGWYVANVPYWILLGLGAGILSLIPYAATLMWPVAIFLKYLDMSMGSGTTDNFWMQLLVWPSAVYLGVQFIEGWIMTPWIQSQSTDMSAGTILFVVLIGGSIGGILGLILAIPFTACLKIILKEVLIPRVKEWGMVVEHPTTIQPEHEVTP